MSLRKYKKIVVCRFDRAGQEVDWWGKNGISVPKMKNRISDHQLLLFESEKINCKKRKSEAAPANSCHQSRSVALSGKKIRSGSIKTWFDTTTVMRWGNSSICWGCRVCPTYMRTSQTPLGVTNFTNFPALHTNLIWATFGTYKLSWFWRKHEYISWT